MTIPDSLQHMRDLQAQRQNAYPDHLMSSGQAPIPRQPPVTRNEVEVVVDMIMRKRIDNALTKIGLGFALSMAMNGLLIVLLLRALS